MRKEQKVNGGGKSLLNTNSIKSNFRFKFFTTFLVTSTVLFCAVNSFAKTIKQADIDIKINAAKDPNNFLNNQTRIKKLKEICDMINEFLKQEKIPDNIIKPIILDLSNSFVDTLLILLDTKYAEIDKYFENQKAKEIDDAFYDRYNKLVYNILESQNQNTLFDICNFIKQNHTNQKFISCNISDNYNCDTLYSSKKEYDELFANINNCLNNTFRYSCNDLFEYHKAGEVYDDTYGYKANIDIVTIKLPNNIYVSDAYFPANLDDKENLYKATGRVYRMLKYKYKLQESEISLYNASYIQDCVKKLMKTDN